MWILITMNDNITYHHLWDRMVSDTSDICRYSWHTSTICSDKELHNWYKYNIETQQQKGQCHREWQTAHPVPHSPGWLSSPSRWWRSESPLEQWCLSVLRPPPLVLQNLPDVATINDTLLVLTTDQITQYITDGAPTQFLDASHQKYDV